MNVWPCTAKFASRTTACATVVLALSTATVVAKTWHINNVDQSVSIHLRELPNIRSKIVAYIPVEATGLTSGLCNDRWCEVEYNGVKGWVFRKYLAADEEGAAPASPDAAPVASSAVAPPDDLETNTPLPAPLPPATELPIRRSDGPPVPVYAFPSDKLPIAGHLAQDAATVQSLGACVRNWCYIRSGSLVGWLPQDRFAVPPPAGSAARQAPQRAEPQTTASTSAEPPALNSTESTATQTALLNPAIPEAVKGGDTKFYSLAGLSSGASLAIRQQPGDDAPVLGSIPANASDIEGLHKCTGKWCLVRHHEITGWVIRRHLTDPSLAGTQNYLVTGVELMDKLDVLDSPASDAGVVGRIPAYATGIVPIGGCDKLWCHVRYLGLAGWVRTEYLAPGQ